MTEIWIEVKSSLVAQIMISPEGRSMTKEENACGLKIARQRSAQRTAGVGMHRHYLSEASGERDLGPCVYLNN